MDLKDLLRGTRSVMGLGGSSGISSRKSLSMVWWTWMLESWGSAEELGLDRIGSSSKVETIGAQGKGEIDEELEPNDDEA